MLELMDTCAKAEQPWNMLLLTPADPATTADTNPVQPRKIEVPSLVTEKGTATDFNDVQERNASLSMNATDEEMATALSEEHARKELYPI